MQNLYDLKNIRILINIELPIIVVAILIFSTGSTTTKTDTMRGENYSFA